MPARGHRTRDGVFEPHDLKRMAEAYEQVLRALDVDEGPHGAIPRDQRRTLVADAILGGSRRGVDDPQRLEKRALKRLAGFAAQRSGHGRG